MNGETDADRIENGIEQERAALKSTLEELQDRVSIENLRQEALKFVSSNFDDYSQALDRAVRANPLALVVAGAGLAWLAFGARKPAAEALIAPAPQDIKDEWSNHLDRLRDQTALALHAVERDALEHSEGDRDFAAERAAILAGFSEEMRQSLQGGLDGMSAVTRARMVDLRDRANAKRIQSEQNSSAGKPKALQIIEDHPLIVGGAAMALGAAFALLIPHKAAEPELEDPLTDTDNDVVVEAVFVLDDAAEEEGTGAAHSFMSAGR